MYTLIIYEEIPEKTRLFCIENSQITPEMRSLLAQTQNKFINNDDMNDGMQFLNAAICDACSEPGYEQYAGIWAKHEVKVDEPLQLAITHVYLTGFVL